MPVIGLSMSIVRAYLLKEPLLKGQPLKKPEDVAKICREMVKGFPGWGKLCEGFRVLSSSRGLTQDELERVREVINGARTFKTTRPLRFEVRRLGFGLCQVHRVRISAVPSGDFSLPEFAEEWRALFRSLKEVLDANRPTEGRMSSNYFSEVFISIRSPAIPLEGPELALNSTREELARITSPMKAVGPVPKLIRGLHPTFLSGDGLLGLSFVRMKGKAGRRKFRRFARIAVDHSLSLKLAVDNWFELEGPYATYLGAVNLNPDVLTSLWKFLGATFNRVFKGLVEAMGLREGYRRRFGEVSISQDPWDALTLEVVVRRLGGEVSVRTLPELSDVEREVLRLVVVKRLLDEEFQGESEALKPISAYLCWLMEGADKALDMLADASIKGKKEFGGCPERLYQMLRSRVPRDGLTVSELAELLSLRDERAEYRLKKRYLTNKMVEKGLLRKVHARARGRRGRDVDALVPNEESWVVRSLMRRLPVYLHLGRVIQLIYELTH